ASRNNTSLALGCFRSRVIERLLRLLLRNPAVNPPRRLAPERVESPMPGASTLITSAPWSARIIVASGPETFEVRSTMRYPWSGPGMAHLSRLACGNMADPAPSGTPYKESSAARLDPTRLDPAAALGRAEPAHCLPQRASRLRADQARQLRDRLRRRARSDLRRFRIVRCWARAARGRCLVEPAAMAGAGSGGDAA